MSGRQKKNVSQTTITSKTTISSPAASSTPAGRSSGASAARPPSPTMISRMQEKNELASLNDRLASYIDRVRQLETENTRLSRVVQTHEETVSSQVSGIKGLYEGELSSARKLLDEMAKEKAKLQFEVGKYKTELDDLRDKLKTKDRDLTNAEKKLLSAESQVNELQARLNDAVNQRRHWEDEYNKLKKEFEALSKALATAKKQLEEETIARVDLENRIQSLKEELAFKSQIHEQEINESVHRSRVTIEEVDGKLQYDYDSKLAEALRQMREENEDQIRAMREETEHIFEKKFSELQDAARRNDGTAERAQAELRNSRKRFDELQSEVTRLTTQNQTYEARIRDLESQLQRDRDEHQITIDTLESEIRRLRASLEDQLQEYRDLMDVKIQLDSEIAAYRKLLESEESRLNISSAEGATPGRTPASEFSRKRKRMTVEPESSFSGAAGGRSIVKESAASSDYTSSSKAKDIVEINECDTEGKFIKLFNTSADKDASLGGWQLRQVAGDSETTYKFHRSVHLKPQQYVTVWSSDSDQTHTPPSTLVMKDQAWSVGDTIKATLIDTKGEEMASRDLARSMQRTTYSKTSYLSSSSSYATDADGGQGKTPGRGWLGGLFGSSSK